MSTPLLNCFWIGPELPDSQIFSSASRSKFPAVSTAKCVMDLYGTLWYSILLAGQAVAATSHRSGVEVPSQPAA